MDKLLIDKVRVDTLGIKHGIFMNNAGASLRPSIVTETVKNFLDLEDKVGGHEAARLKACEIDQAYNSIAMIINAERREIALMESNTIAWHAIVSALELNEGDEIIVTNAEYISGLFALMELQYRRGVKIHVVNYDRQGLINLTHLGKLLSNRTKLVCLTHISTSNGTVHSVIEAGEIIKAKSDAFYLVDASQSVGQLCIDVKKIGCDGLTATGRKYLRGPRGTGFLYIKSDAQKRMRPMFPDGHRGLFGEGDKIILPEDASRFETFEKSLANFAGLGVAATYANNLGIGIIEQRINQVVVYLRELLNDVDGLKVCETEQDIHSGLITIVSHKSLIAPLYKHLSAQNTAVKHIKTVDGAWDFKAKNQKECIRLSIHYFNTEKECDEVVAQITNFIQ